MRLSASPGLSSEQRLALLDAALPDVRSELAAGATTITAESDGDAMIVIKSDRLDAPKVVKLEGA